LPVVKIVIKANRINTLSNACQLFLFFIVCLNLRRSQPFVSKGHEGSGLANARLSRFFMFALS
jgi:hypothetical protein